MWGSERQGPLDTALGASHGGGAAPGDGRLLLPALPRRARSRRASTSSARGRATSRSRRWVAGLKADRRPADGAFVTFWRILVEYPEVLAWERLWNEGAARHLPRHVPQGSRDRAARSRSAGTSGTPTRSRRSTAPSRTTRMFAAYSDFLKVVMYHNCGGPRMAHVHPQRQRDAVRGPHAGADDAS